MIKGDIVLIAFPFTDLSGAKNRPAVVLFCGEIDIIVAFVTTRLKWEDEFDLIVEPADSNGLKRDSLVRLSKLATLDKNLALGKIGILSDKDLEKVNSKLISIFKLGLSQTDSSQPYGA